MIPMRSDEIKNGVMRAASRSLLKSTGLEHDEIRKPFIAIVNSFNEIVPGHTHLNKLSKAVKEGIRSEGGIPFEFHTIAVCDGICQGTDGMKYSLPSRDIITDSIEIMIEAHKFDAMVLIPSCDKSVPGMLNAIARINIPSIVVTGGPMLPGEYEGRKISLVEMREYIGKYKNNEITLEELYEIEGLACPGSGSCSMFGTANTMAVVTEALGLSLPGCATSHAVMESKMEHARESGKQIMKILENNLLPKEILTIDAIKNAIRVVMSLGGSLNSVLHISALANELDLKNFDLKLFDELSSSTPYLCKLKPSGNNTLLDLDESGGIPVVMKLLNEGKLLNDECLTVTGKTVKENLQNISLKKNKIVQSIETPIDKEGGIAILHGNLAPNGCVVKKSAVPKDLLVFQGKAKVFEDLESTLEALWNNKINDGEILVVRYEGPRGGPGMREQHAISSLISGLNKKVGLITDGRFSGSSRGAVIGHISPETASGGPIGIVEENDIISIDIPNRRLELKISKREFQDRLVNFIPEIKKVNSRSILSRYRKSVGGAEKGAVQK